MYTPVGMFSTPHFMRLLLADCPIVRELLGTTDLDETLAKITTYGEAVTDENAPVLSCPSIMVSDSEVHISTDELGTLMEIPQRTIETWVDLYVSETYGNDSHTDQHGWVNEQFGTLVEQVLARQGRGEPVAGRTHLSVSNPVYYGCERRPDDMRADERLDPFPELSRWFGLLVWEVR